MSHFIASLLDPIAARLLPLLPGVTGAAVTVTPGGRGLDAWRDGSSWTLKVGTVWLEVDLMG